MRTDQHHYQHQHRHQHHYCDSQPCHHYSRHIPDASHLAQEPDTTTAPSSTSIDILVYPGTNVTLLQEDLDTSQTNLLDDVRFHDISARISALANGLLAEEMNNAFPTVPPQSQSDASNNLRHADSPNPSKRPTSLAHDPTDSFAYHECQSPNFSDIVSSHPAHPNSLSENNNHVRNDPITVSAHDNDLTSTTVPVCKRGARMIFTIFMYSKRKTMIESWLTSL